MGAPLLVGFIASTLLADPFLSVAEHYNPDLWELSFHEKVNLNHLTYPGLNPCLGISPVARLTQAMRHGKLGRCGIRSCGSGCTADSQSCMPPRSPQSMCSAIWHAAAGRSQGGAPPRATLAHGCCHRPHAPLGGWRAAGAPHMLALAQLPSCQPLLKWHLASGVTCSLPAAACMATSSAALAAHLRPWQTRCDTSGAGHSTDPDPKALSEL